MLVVIFHLFLREMGPRIRGRFGLVDIGSCMFIAGFTGDDTSRAEFSSMESRPKIFGIMVFLDRPGSGRARRRHWQLHVQGLFCW